MKNSLIGSYVDPLTTGLDSSSIWQWYSKCIGVDQQANKDEKLHFDGCDLQCHQNETVLGRFVKKAFYISLELLVKFSLSEELSPNKHQLSDCTIL